MTPRQKGSSFSVSQNDDITKTVRGNFASLLPTYTMTSTCGVVSENKSNDPSSVDHSPKASLVDSFHSKGFLRLNLLQPDTCRKLRTYILQELSALLVNENEHEGRFSNIRERKSRWDLKLPSASIVEQAMAEILQSQQPHGDGGGDGDFLKFVLSPLNECDNPSDLVLAELGSLISEPGAKHQQWHCDTAHTGPTEPDCICCFVTLQDTPVSMGPTQLIPYTHEADFHENALSNFPPKGLMPTSVEPKSMQNGFESAGEGLLMDCRLYHRGSANTYQPEPTKNGGDENDDGKRVVFYFTMRSRKAPKPCGFLFTILEELEGVPLVDFLR